MDRRSPTPFHPFEAAVLRTIRREELLGPGTRVLAALSGGPDSTALVASLAALTRAGLVASVSACHVDHGLREGSAAEGDLCARTCELLGVQLARLRVVVDRTGNLQAAARRARYQALRGAARQAGADVVATGHTRSDQAETVLHRLLRGAGARGLGGIPPRRGDVVRPLLDRSRQEVVAYLRARGLSWCEDPTNATRRFLRNRIRSEALPLLEALAPGVEERLARAADLLREDDRALEAAASLLLPGEARSVPLADLCLQPVAVRRRVVRLLWRGATGSRRGLDAAHVDRILARIDREGLAARPARLALPAGQQAQLAYGRLEISPEPPAVPKASALPVRGPGRYEVDGKGVLELLCETGGLDAVGWPLELRCRRPGDRFRPRGGAGSKKLKAWLIDHKVPQRDRDGLVVLARGSEVLLIPQLGAEAAGLRTLAWTWGAAPT